jgi:hypothetical protein
MAERHEIVERAPADVLLETSTERFDRIAFAEEAVRRLRPVRTTVAIAQGVSRVRVEAGRAFGAGEGARWAMLLVPPNASRRAIAVAVAAIGGAGAEPWALDALLADVARAV